MSRVPTPPSPDEDGGAGRSLRIPRARFVNKGGNDNRVGILVTPLYAKKNGLHAPGRGFFICTWCDGELEARFEGPQLPPYFAHWRGRAVDCELKAEGDGQYRSYESKSWKEGLRTRNRTLGLHLKLIPRPRDVLLTANGPTLPSEDYHAIAGKPHELFAHGVEGTFTLAQLAWSRPSFDVKVADPNALSIALKHSAGRFVWTPVVTPQERQWGCIVLAGAPGSPMVQAAEVQPGADLWWLIHRSATDLAARLKSIDSTMDFAKLEHIPVSGSSGWQATKLPWNWGTGRPRQLMKALGIKPEKIGRPFRLTPLSGTYDTSGEVTVVEVEGTSLKAMLMPEIFAGLQVEIIPLPYDPNKVTRKALPEDGALLSFEMEPRERSSDCYLLALDPQDNHRFLSQHRLTLLRQDPTNEVSGAAIRLGVQVRLGDENHFLSPVGPQREIVLDFGRLSSLADSNPPGIELVAPPYADGEASTPSVEVRTFHREAPTVPTMRQEARDAPTFARLLSLVAGNEDLRTISIRFGALGEVRFRHKEASILERRHALRIRLGGRILRDFAGLRRMPVQQMADLMAEATREGDVDFPWQIDFENVYTIARKFENRRAEGMEAMLDYVFTNETPIRTGEAHREG